MTLAVALAHYAAAYRNWAIAKGHTYNIEAATQYATIDLMNLIKTSKEEHKIQIVQEETEIYTRGV